MQFTLSASLAAAVAALALAACSPPTAEAPEGPAAEKSPYAFDLDITLSPKAAELLDGEISVGASYEAKANAAKAAEADEFGNILIASENVKLAGAGRASFTGAGVTPEALAGVAEGSPLIVRIGVGAVGKGVAGNLLGCTLNDVNEKPVADLVAGSPHAVLCETIDESVARAMKGN